MKTRWLRLASLALGAVALLAACGRVPGRPDFVFVNGAEPETIDPHIVTGQPEIRIAESLFEGLTTRDGHGRIVPGIAERWDLSPDGRTYTFHLRDAQWSNGDPLTSADFLASWQRALDPKTASGYADFYSYIVNAEAYNQGKITDFGQVGVSAPDPRTVRVTLNYPTPFFLDICAFSTLAPVHLASLQRWGKDWLKPEHLVCDGPYTLEAWRVNDRVVLRKNPRYWNAAAVSFDRIDALSIQSPATAFNLFYSGVADLTMDKSMVPSSFLGELKKEPYYHAHTILGTYFYRCNVTRKPFDDPRVRQALALAIDKRRIVERVTRAGEQPAGSLTPPGFAGYEASAGLGYDPARARALLAEAGFPGGHGFPPFSILYSATGMQNAQIATEIQAIWRENLGIEAGLRAQEWKVYLNTLSGLDYDIGQSSWVGDYPDPNTFLDCFVSGRGNNRTGFSSSAYDGLLADARREVDPARRLEILRRAEALLLEEQPIIPLYYYVGVALYHGDRLGGFSPSPLDEHRLADLYWIGQPKGRGTK